MSESISRIRSLLEDQLDICCDAAVDQRVAELESLASATTGSDNLRPVFATLGDETRYRLARVLTGADRALCVCELEVVVEVSESAVSHALSDLTAAGLATRDKDGNWRYYEATPLAEAVFTAAGGAADE